MINKIVTYENAKDLESEPVEYRDIKDIDPAGLLLLLGILEKAHDKAEAAGLSYDLTYPE